MLLKRRPGFVMAETLVALSLLTMAVSFWGGLEVMMQRRDQAMIQQIEQARYQYEQQRLPQLNAVADA
ncbi:histidine kinase [Lactobacillus sp. CBA3605]|nr:histidine kinase [Lactobacillus sp. CBA3605]